MSAHQLLTTKPISAQSQRKSVTFLEKTDPISAPNTVHALPTEPSAPAPFPRTTGTTPTAVSVHTKGTAPVILPTVLLEIADAHGHFHKARALLDCGSMLSFITQAMAQHLRLPKQKVSTKIIGVGNSETECSRAIVDITFRPCKKQGPLISTRAHILKNVTGALPTQHLHKVDTSYAGHQLPLADSSYNVPSPIDLLLGSDVFALILDGDKVSLGPGKPTAFSTIFDFTLLGPINQHSALPHVNFAQNEVDSPHSVGSQLSLSDKDVHLAMERFWEVEELTSSKPVSPLHELCEQIFRSTTTRDPTGAYMVTLPFLPNAPELGSTHAIALRRFLNLERKLSRDPQLRDKYVEFMTEYIDLGHMTPCHPRTFAHLPHYYIPHHGVFRPDSQKIRTVFDGSCKGSNGVSLNDCLHTGPALQRDITDIILRFRTHSVVFCTDIKMMFRKILMHPDFRRYQLILWRSAPDKPLLTYALNTVTYGLRSSPYHAIRTLLQLVEDEGHRYPRAAEILQTSIFVDDILAGGSSVSEARALQLELIELLSLGGFELRKWMSNTHQLLDPFPDDHCSMPKNFDLSPESTSVKVLGVQWTPNTDEFTYRLSLPHISTITKRSILSATASLYDPNGWIGPVIFRAKLLIQKLWTLSMDWDEAVPADIAQQWQSIYSDLPALSSVHVPRHIRLSRAPSTCSLHGFADASESGYAAVVYLLEQCSTTGAVSVHLLLAKSKVAPLKSRLTIPKMELSAAALLTQLMNRVSALLSAHFTITQHYAWTDSTIVLAWLHTPPHTLQTFESNRVSAIQGSTCQLTWRHVPSQLNPADAASRGMSALDLSKHELWWSPPWLKHPPETWPPIPPALGTRMLPGLKPRKAVAHIAVPDVDTELLTRFSSLDKLIGVTAYVRRFIRNARSPRDQRKRGLVTAAERSDALFYWIRSVQQNEFSEDIHRLSHSKEPTTRLRRLSPFLSDGLLRVGGRLANSALRPDARHPLVLPAHSPLVDLLIDHYHRIHCHPGADTLHSLLRQRYWILSARRVIRHRVFKCMYCFRLRAQPKPPYMADLPPDRVTPQPVFSQVSLDFAGPFLIKSSTLRNAKLLKGYFCIFVCLATKAVHLEAVSDLSTEAFLSALQRFVSRRGTPALIRSDCGTNFVGARNELKVIQNFLKNSDDAIHRELATRHITWWLQPPSAPSFGGLHETAVKSTKQLLYRTVGDQHLTFEEFSTLLARIEAVLNSRPLCPLSSDPNDFQALTAGHFLVGRPLTALPEVQLEVQNIPRLKRFKLISALSQHFWRRWSQTYLHTLQTRSKWTSKSAPPQVGELVLIKDDNLPPLHWRLGRIIRTLPSRDGSIRVLEIATASGNLQRPLLKLARLPCQD